MSLTLKTLVRTGVVSAVALLCCRGLVASQPSDIIRAEFESWIQHPNAANATVYNATDSAGNGMDCAKIIEDPNGGYIAVYHVLQGSGLFSVYLATSTDLVHWTYQANLGTQASQPTIQLLSNGGFLVLWEAVNSSGADNHIRFSYYSSRANLFAATTSQTFDAPQTLSTCAEGTPSIYSVTLSPDLANSVIDVGGHYNSACSVDQQQHGKLIDFTTWVTAPANAMNNAVKYFGVNGNIGERDAVNYRGYNFELIEGNPQNPVNWSDWGIYCYDFQTGNADQLAIKTAGGSTSFANPRITRLTAPNGQPAIVVTIFIPSQGAAAGEAGEMIYYQTYGYTTSDGDEPATLTSDFNRTGIYTNGSTFSSTGGFDGVGYAYSSYLFPGSLNTWQTPEFSVAAADANDVVSASGQTIALPAAEYGTLNLLGAAVNGAQPSQTFTVTYSDQSSVTFSQNMSDWCIPQNYTGETTALRMSYRDEYNGTENSGSTCGIYTYSLGLNPEKTLNSVTLPNNSNVEILAITPVAMSPTWVSLASAFNAAGIYIDGVTFSSSGGADGQGNAYSGDLLGLNQTWGNNTFSMGLPNSNNVVKAAGNVINLPSGQFSTLKMLATGVNGAQTSQVFTVTYSDNSTATFKQSLSDWHTSAGYTGESIAYAMDYRDTYSGSKNTATFNLYGYAFAINNAKIVKSITLPSNSDVVVSALTLAP
jgi:hypothetical protein